MSMLGAEPLSDNDVGTNLRDFFIVERYPGRHPGTKFYGSRIPEGFAHRVLSLMRVEIVEEQATCYDT